MRIRSLAAAVAVGALLAGACGDGGSGDGDSRGGTAELSGTISVDGSSTVGPITEAVAEEFGAEHSDVEVAVGISGTGGGFEKFCAGETDINDASRPIKDEELAECEANGISPIELTVALDGLAVIANPDVDWAECLTFPQLKQIWDAGSTVKSWKDVDAKFPSEPMPLFGPGTDSGTFDYFTDEINGEEGQSRSDYTASEDDNVLVRGISGQPGALGYFGVAYYEQNKSRLKAMGVDSGDGRCAKPTAAAVRDGSYPLSRPLFIYVSDKSVARAEMKAFIEFYLDNVSDLVADVGYVSLRDADLKKSREAYEAAS